MAFERKTQRTDVWSGLRVEQIFEVLRRLLQPVQSYAADVTLKNNTIVAVDATSAAITVTLQAAANHNGRIYTVKKVDSSANAVTLTPDGSETIDGASSYALSAQWDVVTIVSDGTQWLIV